MRALTFVNDVTSRGALTCKLSRRGREFDCRPRLPHPDGGRNVKKRSHAENSGPVKESHTVEINADPSNKAYSILDSYSICCFGALKLINQSTYA